MLSSSSGPIGGGRLAADGNRSGRWEMRQGGAIGASACNLAHRHSPTFAGRRHCAQNDRGGNPELTRASQSPCRTTYSSAMMRAGHRRNQYDQPCGVRCGQPRGSLLPSPGQGSRAFVGRTGCVNLLKAKVEISQYDIKHRGILFASTTLVSRCVVSKRVHGPAPQGGAVLLSERQPELR